MKVLLNEIRENEDNPRAITEENLNKLVNSLLIFPKMLALRKIIVSSLEEKYSIGGNMRQRALNIIVGLPIEDISQRIIAQKEKRGLDDATVKTIVAFWEKWQKEPYVDIEAGDFTKDEEDEFIIKDNVSAGTWDYDMLQNFDQQDLQDWGLTDWISIPDFMQADGTDFSDSDDDEQEERKRIIITYPRDRVNELNHMLGIEISRNNYRLEEILMR